MKVLVDIGHPAHVHYFKNVINILKSKGHSVIVVSREKEMTFSLLYSYKIPFLSRGKGKDSLIGKFFYLFVGSYKIWKIAKINRINLYLSFASPYNAISSFFYNKPCITFDDTEHNIFNHKIYSLFSSIIFTPKSFKKEFGKYKHLRFIGTMDSAYLHPKYFSSKEMIFNNNAKDSINKKNVLLRFVSWTASHDINQTGFHENDIFALVNLLSPFANVFISSEKPLPKEFQKYSVKINPSDMHSFIHKMDLFIGESGSMATEASYLGTHSIVLNSAANEFGVFDWFSRFSTFYIAKDFKDVLEKSKLLIQKNDLAIEANSEAKKIIRVGICLTDFIVWFIENYPKSVDIMKNNSDYQYNFK